MGDPRIVAFLCEESGAMALKFIREKGLKLPDGVKFIEVPCSGRVDIEFLAEAIKEGADGVYIFGCFDDNCRYNWGNKRAKLRVERLKSMAKALGLNDNAIDFIPVASAGYMRLYNELWKRYETLKNNGGSKK